MHGFWSGGLDMVGGMMAMGAVFFFFVAVVWVVLPFAVFSSRGKTERCLEALERIEKRLSRIEERIGSSPPQDAGAGPAE